MLQGFKELSFGLLVDKPNPCGFHYGTVDDTESSGGRDVIIVSNMSHECPVKDELREGDKVELHGNAWPQERENGGKREVKREREGD